MYIYHNFFIHSPLDGHLGCFHDLASVNTAAINNGIYVSLSVLGIRLGVWWPGHMVVLFLVFKGISILSSIVVVFTFPPTVQEGSFFSTPSPTFIVYRLFDDGHSDWCGVIPHCSFDLHFSNKEWSWASFHVFASHLYVFFEETSV